MSPQLGSWSRPGLAVSLLGEVPDEMELPPDGHRGPGKRDDNRALQCERAWSRMRASPYHLLSRVVDPT